ncbi:putative translational regulatory protein ArgL [Enterobacter sp.]|uniref:putative translational regulatory protein ArgL n=1 Tax=Enterobacter sp. TaxID=42895 RepID=UPI0039951EDB
MNIYTYKVNFNSISGLSHLREICLHYSGSTFLNCSILHPLKSTPCWRSPHN